jgi:hypothetical protein
VPLADFNLHFELGSGGGGGQRAGFLVLIGLVLSFGFIRMSTRLMRSPKVPWWPGSIKTEGGIHVHHLVFGIFILLIAGFLAFALEPESPWLEILALAFGVGAGLTLDEYALFLHLEDVYWAEEGRRSVDAVILSAALALVILLGFVPWGESWVLDLSGFGGPTLDTGESTAVIVAVILIDLALCAVAAMKGKVFTAMLGMFIPPVGLVGAIRLAKPDSPWARRRYAPDSEKLAKATARYERHAARVRRWQDLIGGAPTPAEPPS